MGSKKLLFLSLLLIAFSGAYTQSCTANFTHSTSNCPNIYFFDNSFADTTILCWFYDYQGQGSNDACTDAHNKFNANGHYEVCLTIVCADGCTDTWCDSVTVDCICDAPNAGYDYAITGLNVAFTDTSWSSYANPNRLWDFGDGAGSGLQNPSHTYSQSGNYLVCLSIQDSCDQNQECRWVNVLSTGTGMHLGEQAYGLSRGLFDDRLVLAAKLGFLPGDEIRLHDISGKMIRSQTVFQAADQLIWNGGRLAAGIYLLEIHSDYGDFRQKTLLR